MPMIHERNPDTGEIRSRQVQDSEFLISQYNRNREFLDQIQNINQISKDEK